VILRLTPAHGDSLDRAIGSIDELVIVRRADGCFAQLADEQVAAFVCDLAYAGIAAIAVECDLASRPAGIPATAPDLHPAPVELVISDSVRVRRLSLGAATAEVLRRRFALFRAPSADAQKTCRRLLRNEDVMFTWRRQAFIERNAVRATRKRSSLRPVIFDRGALGRAGGDRRALASDAALARWAFG
jgi:hypothetical protein